jgi:hypothetical protein
MLIISGVSWRLILSERQRLAFRREESWHERNAVKVNGNWTTGKTRAGHSW